jgi:nicotinate-nucleotide pyrophosphorylase (carboxylating)
MELAALVDLALDEDLGPGDLTTTATVPADARGRGVVLAKQELVVSGHDAARAALLGAARRLGGDVRYDVLVSDGTRVADRTVVATVEGSYRALLVGERLALNFLMRLSGIATRVRRYTDAAGPKIRVVDTRKTTPLFRALEKAAVRHGGGHNHRFGLFDGVLVKDNHIAAVGGDVGLATTRAKEAVHHLVKVEVEVTRADQIPAALAAGADALLLDNMDDDALREAISIARRLKPGVILEASGNINPERLERLRDLDLDVASAGGLIHQATWADLSLDLELIP